VWQNETGAAVKRTGFVGANQESTPKGVDNKQQKAADSLGRFPWGGGCVELSKNGGGKGNKDAGKSRGRVEKKGDGNARRRLPRRRFKGGGGQGELLSFTEDAQVQLRY